MNKYQIGDSVAYMYNGFSREGKVYAIKIGTKVSNKQDKAERVALRTILPESPISYSILGAPECVLEKDILCKL